MKKQKKKMIIKNETGVTLIALIITIIVLLILAGVTISLIIRREWNFESSNKCSK